MLGNMWIVIINSPACDGVGFEINLTFLSSQRAFNIKQKRIFVIWKGFSLKQINEPFWKAKVRL